MQSELTKQERKILKVKTEILNTARNFFLTKGYENVTMDEIADFIPISKTTIYKYFTGKEEILHLILTELLDSINSMFDKRIDKKISGFEQMNELANDFFSFFKENKILQHFFLLERGINSKLYHEKNFKDILDGMRMLFKRASDLLEKGIKDRSIKPGINPEKTGIEIGILVLGLCSVLSERKYYILCEETGQHIENIVDGVINHIMVVINNLKA